MEPEIVGQRRIIITTPDEAERIAARRRDRLTRLTLEQRRAADVLEKLASPKTPMGRPRTVLPPDVAARALELLENRLGGKKGLARVLGVSVQWLSDAWQDGRLARQAAGEDGPPHWPRSSGPELTG